MLIERIGNGMAGDPEILMIGDVTIRHSETMRSRSPYGQIERLRESGEGK